MHTQRGREGEGYVCLCVWSSDFARENSLYLAVSQAKFIQRGGFQPWAADHLGGEREDIVVEAQGKVDGLSKTKPLERTVAFPDEDGLVASNWRANKVEVPGEEWADQPVLHCGAESPCYIGRVWGNAKEARGGGCCEQGISQSPQERRKEQASQRSAHPREKGLSLPGIFRKGEKDK